MSQRALRIGLFGGAFDPPHDAHVALARAALAQLALDRLHILPTGNAWHKARQLTPAAHRLALCRLAFADLPGVCVDAREVQRPGPTYTFDTLTELHAEQPAAQLVLLIGTDQAAAFHSWHRAPEILQLATIAIALRSDSTSAEAAFDPEHPLPGLAVQPAQVLRLKLPAMPHSATEVRRRVAAGLPIAPLVPPAVAGYIAEHHLYRTS